MNTSKKRTQAQIDAEKKYDAKRKDSARLPGTKISDKQSAKMNKLYKLFDTKTEAILEAVEFYLKKNK